MKEINQFIKNNTPLIIAIYATLITMSFFFDEPKQEFVILDSQFDDVFDKLTNEHLLDKYCVSLGFEAGYISQQLVNCYIPDEQRRSYSLKEYYLWTLTI